MNDKILRQNVIDELDFEPSIEAANIGVAVEHGVVTLTGHVPNYLQKTNAERATWRVKGVKAIAQEVEVRFASDKKSADDQIAERILTMLSWDASVPKDTIRVKVQKGWVTLDGDVHWNFQRSAAEADVRKLTGVIAVTNNIAIKPTAQAPDIQKRIEDALKRYAELEAGQITVDVRENGTIRLDGKVHNWDELQTVKRAAWSAPGVRLVDDHLRIGM